MSAQPRYIAIEGAIGAGKTSLARRLGEHLGYRTLFEDPGANPFLPGFYEDPARHALPAQLHFLLQRIEQVSALGRGSATQPGTVADFLLDKDPLFAELNLAPAEWALYRELYRRVAPQAPAPDLVVYLQASPAIALERVRRRRIGYERGLALDYLARLADAYARFFHDYAAAPLLIVNSDHLNFVDRDSDFELLLQRIRALKGPREYFSLG